MEKSLQKYTGRIVEIIYLDRDNRITQRRIEVRAIYDGVVKAFCLERHAPRIFQSKNILAVQSVRRTA
ncbi:hypothetical protein O9H85_15445 [Paenibacillus filicis]|uniref:WYL domain-containing protein n=1 Tax=Paenibacillus gyeongsangnamensis TaxID=3388067 RepID=A0ABT4QAA3_9BACL|nr:hypothetical protein [Paenibacillus filicis]MCZ8513803.1 hypothetical protein [Paenibacillus filicis]